MTEQIVNDKYAVIKTVFTEPYQSVHIVKNVFADNEELLILNSVIDTRIIPRLVNVFLENYRDLQDSFVEFFYTAEIFYVVSKLFPGQSLYELLSQEELTEDEKRSIAYGFLRLAKENSKLPLLLQQCLCNYGNITVEGKKKVRQNHFYSFTEEDFSVENEDMIRKIGEILLAIFTNSMYAEEEGMGKLSPRVRRIIEGCLNKEYTSAEQIYSDYAIGVMRKLDEIEHKELLTDENNMYLSRSLRHGRKKQNKAGWVVTGAAVVLLLAVLMVLGFKLQSLLFGII